MSEAEIENEIKEVGPLCLFHKPFTLEALFKYGNNYRYERKFRITCKLLLTLC